MVVLGLGSNIGDRLANLRTALTAIKKIPTVKINKVAPVYISDALLPEGAPENWNHYFLNTAISLTTTMTPPDLLQHLKKIETELGRVQQHERWSPRVMDIDILAWDDREINENNLSIPHPALFDRPFALWPLADLVPLWRYRDKTAAEYTRAWSSRFSGDAPFHTRMINQRIDTPQLVGIINVTPDSFSDGGQFFNADLAIEQALRLVNDGAEILDIGAESTAPNAIAMTPETEWARLEPLLSAIQAMKNDLLIVPKISIDTRHAAVAEKALKFGADWINDVSGLTDPAMQAIVAQTGADCVVMHHVSIPASRNEVLPWNQDPVKLVYEWGAQQIEIIEKAGIASERIIFDPGIGFGKTPEQSLVLLQHVDEFAKLGTRILIGHSRKSFFTLFTDQPAKDRDVETLAATLALAQQPIDYLRVHQVAMCARGLRVECSMRGNSP